MDKRLKADQDLWLRKAQLNIHIKQKQEERTCTCGHDVTKHRSGFCAGCRCQQFIPLR